MKSNWVRIGLVAYSFLLFGQVALSRADIFEIRGGGTITGKLLNDPKSSIFKIRTNDGVEIEIPSGKIMPPELVNPEIESIYKSVRGKEDTPELHRSLGLELNRFQSPLAYAHRERVVELEPSDANWKALGSHAQNKQTGEYERRDVLQKRKGLVSLGSNKWDSPQSQAIAKFKKAEAIDIAQVKKLFNQHLKGLEDKTPKTQSAAADFFDALGDSATFYQKYQLNNRLAIPHIADLIKKSETAPTGFLMDLLAKMPDNSAGSVFVDIAMSSTNPRLQEQALELLNRTELSREFAYHQFMAVIGNTKAIPDVVDRAGSNLQVFADKRAIPHLIDRLVTKVTRSITSSGSNTFNKDGSGGGMTTGGTQKVEFPYNQQSIWKALVGLADGSDYQYDMQKWRIWYANTYAKSNLDLRRDE